jgi:hypothetical protein
MYLTMASNNTSLGNAFLSKKFELMKGWLLFNGTAMAQ